MLERIVIWVRWFGPGRLLFGAIGLVGFIVLVGASIRQPPVPRTVHDEPERIVEGGRWVTLVPGPEDARSDTIGSPVIVHVSGAVANPGVHELSEGARVHDAVTAAGGALQAGRLDALNLAAVVVDGARIHVPTDDEFDGSPSAWMTSPNLVAPGTETAEQIVAINRATRDELMTLPGIGPATADAILDHRDRHGPFGVIEDLLLVRGIGPAKLDALRDRIRL